MANRPHICICDFQPNSFVDGTYAIVNPQLGTTRSGKPFLKCLIRDATGECAARKWTVEDGILADVSATGFVWIAGSTQVYDGQVQIILEDVRSVEVSVEELRALLPCTSRDIDEMFSELVSILKTIEHPGLKELARAYLEDEKIMGRLKEAPAAMNLHHAWIGGLLEHTLQLLKVADVMLPHYPQLNHDIVLMGLFLHDLGKTAELTWEKGFNYTTEGNLIGHVAIGAVWLDRKLREVSESGGPKVPANAALVLQHIILSHHNEPEFGAAKRPASPEAIFVSMLDNLDARTAMAIQHCRPDRVPEIEGAGDFTDKIWALDARLFKPDPLV